MDTHIMVSRGLSCINTAVYSMIVQSINSPAPDFSAAENVGRVYSTITGNKRRKVGVLTVCLLNTSRPNGVLNFDIGERILVISIFILEIQYQKSVANILCIT